jgi:uncharacterized membrane protein YgcG
MNGWQRLSGRRRGVKAIAAALIFGLLTAILAVGVSAFENEQRSPGLHDDAGVFSAQQRAEIEAAIARVEATGAPVVVYLRLLHTVTDQAVGDGQRLMDAWSVESTPGARDGVVMFFNLNPSDPNRGEFGVVAGETHFDGGALPQSELNRIRDAMITLLRDDRMAEAVVLGLDMIADRIEAGPPEPSMTERAFEAVGGGSISVLNALGVIGGVVLAAISIGWWRDRPHEAHSGIHRTTDRPGELHPALAGALVATMIDNSQVEATILELAKHRAVAFEPDPENEKRVRLRLIDRSNGANEFEFRLLDILAEEATGGVLDVKALGASRTRWSEVQELMREDLRSVGWFNSEIAGRRWPFYWTGIAASLAGLLFLIPIIVIENPWLFAGGGMLLLVGVFVAGAGASYPETTPAGEQQAVQWRGYRDGLSRAAKLNYGTINLDDAFPYIVAFGLPHHYRKHFEQASEQGYVPMWVDARDRRHPVANNWFIYWNSFHRSVNPQSSSSGGSSFGGAGGGSGGAGGRF